MSSEVWFYPWNQADLADYFAADESRWRSGPRPAITHLRLLVTPLDWVSAKPELDHHRVGRRGEVGDESVMASGPSSPASQFGFPCGRSRGWQDIGTCWPSHCSCSPLFPWNGSRRGCCFSAVRPSTSSMTPGSWTRASKLPAAYGSVAMWRLPMDRCFSGCPARLSRWMGLSMGAIYATCATLPLWCTFVFGT